MRQEMLSNYTKFLIVRHPIRRLVSAYWDKMGLHVTNPDYIKLRQNVIRAMRPHATADEIQTGVPTFQEFITQRLTPSWNYAEDKHWAPYSKKCGPCRISYDYIIKLETIEHDIKPIVSILSEGNKSMGEHLMSMIIPQNSHSRSHDPGDQVIPEMFNLSLSQRAKLEQIYNIDLQLFDYQFDNVTARAGEGRDFAV